MGLKLGGLSAFSVLFCFFFFKFSELNTSSSHRQKQSHTQFHFSKAVKTPRKSN